MSDTRFALAFTAGMLATVNPCGFAMLPAYLSYFIGFDGERHRGPAAVRRAVLVGAAVAVGFVAVFGIAGALLSWFSVSLYGIAPWVTIFIGVGLVILGIGLLLGFEPTAALPKFQRGTGGEGGLRAMFLFGVSYAAASVSCTLPLFVALVSNSFSASLPTGLATYGSFALGMAVVLMVLAVAVAMARESLVGRMKRALRFVNRAAGALLVVTGGYVAYYGAYEIRLGRGAEGDPTVDRVTGWSADIANWVNDVGAVRLAVVLVGLIVLAGLIGMLRADRQAARR